MFRKLQTRLSFFCIAVTASILIAMSFGALLISESGMRKNESVTFQNHVSTLLSYLRDQSTVSHTWAATAEQTNDIWLYIEENGTPLFFNTSNESRQRLDLYRELLKTASHDYQFDFSQEYEISRTVTQTSFTYQANDRQDYYVALGMIPKENSYLGILIVHPLNTLKRSVMTQRLLFLLLDIIALLFLSIFAFAFTKRTIRPVEESQRRQREFVAAASHELRSPLAVILSGLSAMQKADPRESAQFAASIETEGLRMSRLVDDLLALANADSGNWSVQMEDVELDTLLLDLYERYEPLARHKGISFHILLPETGSFNCTCDRQRIEQLLSILIDNALSYTVRGTAGAPAPIAPPNEPADLPRIELSLKQSLDHRILIRVADNGPGIPDDKKSSIFERFYRADPAHEDREHFGLGLCIAAEIAKLHKGSLSVLDTPGGGATFVLELRM
ncbi:sensor histidine kinase [Diplocloster agilis]|uniref:histidine kinase n=1 Tax=Diplocloster agilis TaxID=2850323 RepID=A0A949K0I7_9FIRM|nr:HAMP domain-containing sensor histidine kinase [Diplocloster agilis]MBU9737484.1 HAMP domain-containing histidine kinase [Diplocloster agilis]